jgi:hypothetical protein
MPEDSQANDGTHSSRLEDKQRECVSAYAARRSRRTFPVSGTLAMGFARLKRTSTSFTVSSTRVLDLCNLRVALAASIASRKRFETLFIAPNTSSERIVFLREVEVDLAQGPYRHYQPQSTRNARIGPK